MKGLAAGALIAQRYRLSAPLGAGAQGSVWEAVDTRQEGALRAIKFSHGATQQRAEVEALLRLEHPSLPRAYDYGTSDGGTFLVLERVAGVPLHHGHDPRVVVRALADVASALVALHDAGIIHGDVKPANVLVGAERAWLVDLGMATRQGHAAPSGTLAFMPPEALAGERGPGTDLYALGVTAALALAGAHPLVDDPTDRAALLAAIARRTAPRDAVLGALPPSCRDAVALLLSTDPERRALSARAWLARLARDASQDLSPVQRAHALALTPERHGRLPLIGRDAEREACRAALEQALAGEGAGVAIVGPAGAGRRRLADDAIRATLIAWAARGALPEVVDALPLEVTRPTIVRQIDQTPDAVRQVAAAIERLARFADSHAPLALVATCAEPVGAKELADVAVGPLGRDALAELLESVAGRPASAAAVDAWLEATEGLAGRAVALADAVDPIMVAAATRDELTRRTAADVVSRGRADDLPAEPRNVAYALAAADEPLTPAEVAGIAGVPSAAAHLAELHRRGLAVERDGRVRLLQPLGLDGLEPAARARLGAVLEAYFARHEPGRAAVRARAALLRGDHAAALLHAQAAAQSPGSGPRARAHWYELARELSVGDDRTRFALRLAAELVTLAEPQRALAVLRALPQTPDVLAQTADALRRAGTFDEARALARGLEEHPDDATRAVARIILARDALDGGDADAALAALGPLADGETTVPSLRARALEVAALAALTAGDWAGALDRIERAERLAVAADDTLQRARLRSLMGMASQRRGAHEVGLQAYRDAWTLATDAGDAHGAATYAVNLGAAELECGALGEATHWLARGARSLARLGRMGDLARALANAASLYAFIGDRANACDHASRAEQAARAAGDTATEALAELVAAEASLEGVAAGDALAAAAEAFARGRDPSLAGDAYARAAVAYARGGDLERARAALARAADAPRAVAALAALELAIWAREPAAELWQRQVVARAAVAKERTLEHELHLLALAVHVCEAGGDGAELRRARAAHRARVEALAATLPEALATVFTDHHALPEGHATATGASGPVPVLRPTGNDARWRRLAEITREINTEHRLHALLERVMDAIVELTGAARGFLLLKGSDAQLRVRTARNIGRRDLRGDEMALSRSVAERVARDGEPLVTIDATSDGRLDAFESVHAMRLRSILAVPLVVLGDVVGTIYVDDRFRAGAFGDDALEIAREFAEAAAVAIYNARTQARLRRALHEAERLSAELKARVDAQTVELEATRRALSVSPTTRGRYDAIVGRGPAMLRTLALIDKVAPTSMPVLLQGESGTGKELIARAIHANSLRTAKPFVAENCGAIPETLLESVLFGHVKGAFTGADRQRAGLFEVADGGTLFLDEVGEMSPAMQSKLLRVVQDGEVRPLGGERSKKVDVRVIAATHRDLAEMVRQGRFREDLFYRLAVMVLPVPSLRNRREDLPALIAHFIEKHAKREIGVDRRAMQRLVTFAWPGNVRQLENELMRACVLAEGVIREEDLSPALTAAPVAVEASPRDPLNIRQAVDELERQLVERALRDHGNNQSRAAKALGLSRFGLQKKLKRLRLGAAAAATAATAAAELDAPPIDEDEPTRLRMVK